MSGAHSNGPLSGLGVRVYRLFSNENGKKILSYVTVNWWHATTNSRISFNQSPIGSLYPAKRYKLKLGLNVDFGQRWTGWANLASPWGNRADTGTPLAAA